MKPLTVVIDTKDWDDDKVKEFLGAMRKDGMIAMSWGDVIQEKTHLQELYETLEDEVYGL